MPSFRETWSHVVSQLSLSRTSTAAGPSKAHLQISQHNTEMGLKAAAMTREELFASMGSTDCGMSEDQVQERLVNEGRNTIASEKADGPIKLFLSNFKNPFVMVLIILGAVSFLTDDVTGGVVVAVMVVFSVVMRFIQEYRSSKAAETLKAMVKTTGTVTRKLNVEVDDHVSQVVKKIEVPFDEVVRGDLVHLSAGDMIPADLRLITSKDLFVSESSLTGESMPVEKLELAIGADKGSKSILEKRNLCFLGTNVVSGSGVGIVYATGDRTVFGTLAKTLVGTRVLTSFDKGVNSVTWLLVRFMLVMVPVVFMINGFAKGNWEESFLFAIAVAVGLTPEMLPMVVTANLAKGAVSMSKHKVIVKRLNAIQNFGAMDILCTDKTGTLTQDKIILEEYLDIDGEAHPRVLKYAYLNSFYQTGLKNLLDRAILDHYELHHDLLLRENYRKVDEIPFDFVRKRMSVVVDSAKSGNILICKGAAEEVISMSDSVHLFDDIKPMTPELREKALALVQDKNEKGMRIVALGYRPVTREQQTFSVGDEVKLILMGFIAFLDPPKETAKEAIALLNKSGVAVKILTGDSDVVTRRVCKEVGLEVTGVVLGTELDGFSNEELMRRCENTTVFAKLAPTQKARIVQALKAMGHTVGFLGDGINDAPALRESDVGISVDSATDIARESADIILLEKSLLVLSDGVRKGREIYGNIIKYIKMTASSNFGNVFSVLIASAFLPFLPMLPVQLLVQNLLYDFSQTALPWDSMDEEFLKSPRKWDPSGIAKFMLFIGPISSIFDIITFVLMWFVFKAATHEHQALFQTGWFVEGLLSQTLIVHLIRTQKVPFLQSTASLPVICTTIGIMSLGILITQSGLGQSIGLVKLPGIYFVYLVLILTGYFFATQIVKTWFIKKFQAWL